MRIPYQRWHEAIHRRVSRRKYDARPLDTGKIEQLQEVANELAAQYPGARAVIREEGFMKVVRMTIGSCGLVSGARTYAALLARPGEGQAHLVRAGCLLEGVILEAMAMGVDTCWIGGFFDPREVRKDIEPGGGEEILAITPLGYALDRPTLTERAIKGILRSSRRKSLQELCLEGDPDAAPPWKRAAMEDARLAPSAVNRQPWRFRLGTGELILHSASDKVLHGVSPYLDCGIALLHLIVGAGSQGVDVQVEHLKPPSVARIRA